MRYIGSKISLIKEIDLLLQTKITENEKSFLDLFAGTNVVGSYFQKYFEVSTNDLLYFSYVHSKAVIENNRQPEFYGLKKIKISNPFEHLNKEANRYLLTGNIGYYELAYTPTGNCQYLTIENGKRIDYIRDTIDRWQHQGIINETEFYYLLSSLIDAIPFVSNTTGTYGAFLKHWDKRALKPLTIKPFDLFDNGKNNKAYNIDSNLVVKKISADIIYIDTPYNSRQYASNYHLLENIARNNKPALNGKTKIFDWKYLRSNYSMKREALSTMRDLLKNINCTHLILSYNSEGIISEDELFSLVEEYSVPNTIEIKRIPYAKYPSKIPAKKKELYEILIYAKFKDTVKINRKKNLHLPSNQLLNNSHKLIKSPLNYIGGKYKLLNQIIPLFPKEINTFVDLFSGGANVGINVQANNHVFNDMNSRINELFRYFINFESDDLINQIEQRIEEFKLSKTNEKGYAEFREHYNNNPNPLDLYVLVSYSYNYQFRFNNSMKFNNPFGKNRSCFSTNMKSNLKQFIDRAHTLNLSFTDKLFNDFDFSNINSSDFVYLDPPYLITTGNYNDGNRGFLNWGKDQELEMYNLLNYLNANKVRWALSNVTEHKGKTNNHLLKFIRENNYPVVFLNYNYNNSSYNTKGKDSKEVLVTNYDTTSFKII